MKVYFNGSFSEGKSFWKNRVADKFGFLAIPEQIRVLAAEKEIDSLSKFRINTDNVNKLQEATILRQFDAELQASKMFKNIVACRSIDSLAFLAFFGGRNATRNFMECHDYKEYVEWIKKDSIHFLMLPNKKLIATDGFRDTDWELALQISGAVRMLFEIEGIEYYPVETISAADREKIIFPIIERALREQDAES